MCMNSTWKYVENCVSITVWEYVGRIKPSPHVCFTSWSIIICLRLTKCSGAGTVMIAVQKMKFSSKDFFSKFDFSISYTFPYIYWKKPIWEVSFFAQWVLQEARSELQSGSPQTSKRLTEKRTFLTPWYAHVRVRIRR